mmetsp:Transcript_73983/g.123556  ORF Transcript_73983/g.123556 Transcript_73983/m.123556 type:complete len:346 (+) Transcript_73983:25-1062(+)|eukprot:CAMPEP_0119315622 /NCGR_PEP_ID=MMETSP1333-20130426/36583_1 /TAXON_ID=418940 /ORGANISM="Scyphosphaera apsteinii, Strain RCC1455" /LENGTH=345 /DNA_ID=CAMNT_0007321047 /DNA_START=16 /DNA_END=1053 /DNA_ORIENTATION=+
MAAPSLSWLCVLCGVKSHALVLMLQPTRPVPQPHVPGRALGVNCVATTDEEKALVDASQKVTLTAKAFGVKQAKAAQLWVEEAIKAGDSDSDKLMQMQLQLFEECKLDDESDRCKELSAAIEELTNAVAERKNSPRSAEFDWAFMTGATPIQLAATKLRECATLFGPEQKAAADVWIKKITLGKVSSGAGLLEEQVMLFGECVLSEGSTPSNCQKLEQALGELQLAIETCRVDAQEACSAEDVVAEIESESASEEKESGSVSELKSPRAIGRKRKAVMRFWRKLTGGATLTTLQVARFLADPGQVNAELDGASIDELVARLEEEGVDKGTINLARTCVLPYLPGQ